MTKLNWRDASKELPELEFNDDEVITLHKSGWVSLLHHDKKGFYFIRGDESKDYSDDKDITHFLYLSDIPLPGE